MLFLSTTKLMILCTFVLPYKNVYHDYIRLDIILSIIMTKQHFMCVHIPDPFPVPDFRTQTEENLANELLTQSDRKYIFQTLATLLMTYIPRPSMMSKLQRDFLRSIDLFHLRIMKILW